MCGRKCLESRNISQFLQIARNFNRNHACNDVSSSRNKRAAARNYSRAAARSFFIFCMKLHTDYSRIHLPSRSRSCFAANLRRVASPPRIWRWARLTPSTRRTSRYKFSSTSLRRSVMSLCTVDLLIPKWAAQSRTVQPVSAMYSPHERARLSIYSHTLLYPPLFRSGIFYVGFWRFMTELSQLFQPVRPFQSYFPSRRRRRCAASSVLASLPNAVRRKYPCPFLPNPQPGVPTTFASSKR